MMQVSIVIPMYNEERYLPRCIDSLLKQSFSDFEVIFIDDGSKDKSLKIVSDYSKKDKRIKFLKQNHGGPGKARNLGASKSKGKILVFVDADMVFDKDYIKKLIKPILNKKVIGTSHKYEYVANKDNLWARSWCINRIPENNQKYIGVYRAVLKDKFSKSGGFDPKKGYFDDDLSKLGGALIVNTICYHNNPETLKEAFKHSIWVGKSFYENKDFLKSYFKSYLKYIIFMLSAIVIIMLSFIRFKIDFRVLFIVLSLFILVLLEYISIKRVIKEKYINYLYSIPILNIVKFSGYLIGFIKAIFIG